MSFSLLSISFKITSNSLLTLFKLFTIKETSFTFNSSASALYFIAFSFSSFKGPSLSSYVDIISLILIKLLSVLSNFFSASSFLALYLTIPAASSNNALLSSGFPLNIASIFPCLSRYP